MDVFLILHVIFKLIRFLIWRSMHEQILGQTPLAVDIRG